MGRRTKAQIEKDNIEKSKRIQFTDWLYEQYNVSFMPTSFFVNLDKVYKGTYKNLKKPVPVDDLWEMWKLKMPYLLKVYDRNKKQGKTMDSNQRILYDLSILLSKYDSYLAWKENQQQAVTNDPVQPQLIDYNKLHDNKSNMDKKININKILDEI